MLCGCVMYTYLENLDWRVSISRPLTKPSNEIVVRKLGLLNIWIYLEFYDQLNTNVQKFFWMLEMPWSEKVKFSFAKNQHQYIVPDETIWAKKVKKTPNLSENNYPPPPPPPPQVMDWDLLWCGHLHLFLLSTSQSIYLYHLRNTMYLGIRL